jgi:hypothetical protein
LDVADKYGGKIMSTCNNKISIQAGLRLIVLMTLSITLGQSVYANVGSNWIEQFGITWTFDKILSTDGAGDTYRYGTFANGDYWVVGSVNIEGISPDSITGDGSKTTTTSEGTWVVQNGRTVHGSMVNPSPRLYSTQGYDGNLRSYDNTLNVAFNVSESNLLQVHVDSSLVSSISLHHPGKVKLKTAAILTVLDSAPETNSFRYAYCSGDKTIEFNISDLDYSLLEELDTIATTPSLSVVERNFERVWLDYMPAGVGSYIHPSDNMPEYSRNMSFQIGDAALMLHLKLDDDEAVSNAMKKTLLIRLVQLGIDLYGITQDGGEENWYNNGGVASGRKFPILFAGLMLHDDDMKAIGEKSGDYLYSAGYGPENRPPDYIHFGEDDQTFYVKSNDDVFSQPYELNDYHLGSKTGTVSVTNNSNIVTGSGTNWLSIATGRDAYFGVIDDNQAYNPEGAAYEILSIDSNTRLTLKVVYNGDNAAGRAYRIGQFVYYGHGASSKNRDFIEYTNENIGLPEWAIRHATQLYSAALNWDANYRQTSTTCGWGGWILAVHIMNAKNLWNHDVLFDYMDRYMDIQLSIYGEGSYRRQWTDFSEDMWDTYRYRPEYGPVWTRYDQSDPYSNGSRSGSGNQRPVADAGHDQTVTDTDANGSEQINLDGSGSTNVDGTIVSWVWTDDLGDAIPDGETTTPALSVGVHTITLTVTDDEDLADTDTVTITIRTRPDGTGIAGRWEFNEGNGSTAQDFSGNGNSGILHGPSWVVREGSNTALLFDGVDDYVDCGNDTSLNITDAITISVWVAPSSSIASEAGVVAKQNSGTGEAYGLMYRLGNLGLRARIGGVWNTTYFAENPTPNIWTHLVATYDGSKVQLYKNGIPDNSTSITGSIGISDYSFAIGRQWLSSNSHFNGSIDDVSIYNRALAANDVLDLYNSVTAAPIGSVRTLLESLGTIWLDDAVDIGQLTTNPSDYTISGPDQITVGQVSIDPYNHRVKLFTSPHSKGSDYTLNIAGLGSIDYTYNSYLIGNWKLDEYSGTQAQDSSGNGNTATLQNGPVWTTQGGISLDGGDDAVEIPTTGWDAGSGTLSLWAYADNYSGAQYFFGHAANSSNWIQLYTIAGNLALGLGDDLTLKTDIEALDTNVWYNMALTWDGTNYSVYIDGIEKATGAYSGLTTLNSYADIGNIGLASSRDAAFDGIIGDVRMYNRAYSAAEVQDLYLTYQVNENRQLALATTELLTGGATITYQLQNPEDLPDGATFNDSDGTVTWRPWYDQAGAFELKFAENGQPENTKTYTVVANNIALVDNWYRTWLQAIDKL